MLSNCIKDLLNLKGVIIKSIKNLKDVVEIYIELPISEHTCPCCGAKTSKIHDYYTQTIKDVPIYFKPTNLIYNKRRYKCKHCNKNFYEDNPIISKYHRRTNRLTEFIINELRNLVSCTEVAKKLMFLLILFVDYSFLLLLLILNFLEFFVLMNLKVMLDTINIKLLLLMVKLMKLLIFLNVDVNTNFVNILKNSLKIN